MARFYTKETIPPKLETKLIKAKLIKSKDDYDYILGDTLFFGVGPCLIAKKNEIVWFDNTSKIVPKLEKFPMTSINSISLTQAGLGSKLVFGLSGMGEKEVDIPASPKELEKFYETYMSEREKQAMTKNSHTGDDALSQIQKLSDLLKAGVLSQDEFDKKKQELLERI